uniref:Toxin glutamine deamidase domain-containing protein n=1 Tax=Streptomyces sp. NBC_00180 TaxID=2903632 RepID=A0AAU1IA44_9ACTN
MMLPDELEWVLQMLGYNWPTADEDKLRDSAALWRKFGEDVTDLHTKANTSARTVTANNAGESIDKFTKTYEKFDGGGGDGYLRNAGEAAFLIANVMETCAYLVEFAKWAVIAQLIALAIQIIAAQVATPFTFGLSQVAALGATQAARLLVRRILDELKKALLEALIETMKEPAISAIEAIITDLIRQTVNVGFGAQEGYDVGATLKAGGTAGLDALKQSPQTFAEGVRDSMGKKAGDRFHHAIDSRIDGYNGPSGTPGSNSGAGADGSGDGSSGNGAGSSGNGDSGSGSSNSNSSSDSGSSDSSTSSRSSNGNGPGTNIGSGISADTGGNDIGGPNVGPGPDSGSGSDSNSGPGQNPSSSDTPYSRPTVSPSGSSLSDFDDPSPSGASSNSPGSNGSSGTPSTSGPSHSGGGSGVSGLSSPSPQSTPSSGSPSSSGTSSSPGSGSIGTQIDGLAATAPTQSNAAPAPAADSSPSSSGSRSDGGSAMPTSPTAPSTGGATPGGHHSPGASGGTSTPSATSPNANSAPARNPSAGTPGTPSATGTGPASTPSATPSTAPRSTPAATPGGTPAATPGSASTATPGSTSTATPGSASASTPGSRPASTPDGRAPGAGDGRTPGTQGTPDGRIPAQRPGSTTPGEGSTPRNTPGTTPGDRTPPRGGPGNTSPGDGSTPRSNSGNTTPGDGNTSRNNPTNTTPGDRTPPRNNPANTNPSDGSTPRNNADSNSGTRTQTPGHNPSTTTPNQNPAQSTPPRAASPSTGTPTTTPSTSTGGGPERSTTPSSSTPHTSTPSSGSPGSSTPSNSNPNSSTQPGHTTPGTPGTQNQPGTGSPATPSRPPHQPAGNTPNTPSTPQQPAAQPHKSENTPPDSQQQKQNDQDVTAVPIHTVVTTPPASDSPSHADSATPQPPGSPQANPGDSQNQHPQQDSLDDIRADLDHHPGGLSQPDPADQQALADAVPHSEDGTPERFPDPFGPWTQLQNDGGNTVPGRSNNCADCSRSFLETWYGNPQVSAPRTVDLDENGNHNPFTPEDNANDNQIRWTGAAHTYAGAGGDPNTANNIASTLQQAGPGSAAIVQVDWPGGGGHAFNVVNHDGNIVWIDTQSGEVSDQPLHIDQAEHVWHIPLDADRNPIDTSQPGATDSDQGTDTSQEGTDNSDQGTDTSQEGTDNSDQSPENAQPSPETTQQDAQTSQDGTNSAQQETHDSPEGNQDHQTTESDSTAETTDGTPSDNADPSPSDNADPSPSENPDPSPSDTADPTHSKDEDPTQTENPDSGPSENPDSGPSEKSDPGTSESPDPTTTQNPDDSSPQDPSRPDPLPATATRDTTPPGGVTHPTPAEQDALENSVPRDENGDPSRPPNPTDGPWVQHINGDGADSPGRNNNCVDVALSTVDTYAGNPTAAAARTPDPNPDGTPSDRGEKAGRDRIENTLGARFTDLGNGRDAFNRLENTLRNSGHGSQAVIITQDANGRPHAWNAVNHNGRVTYVDAQTGRTSPNPLHNGSKGVFAIPLDANRQPVTPSNPSRSDSSGPPPTGSDTSTETPRRPAADPAGPSPALTPHEDDGHPRLERESPTTVRSTLPPDDAQARVRETNPVFRLQHGAVDQQLRQWADNGQLAQVLRVAAGETTDSHAAAHRPRVFTADGLNTALPGFSSLNRGEQMLVISTLARLSHSAHEQYGVNSSPVSNGKESEGLAKHKEIGARAKAVMKRLKLDHPPEHIPDFSQRNYAVVEIEGPHGTEYVVDSSYPPKSGAAGKHSESHLADWIDDVKKAHGPKYKITALYTEREPCGDKKGGLRSGNCSNLLGQRLAGVPVYYSTTYRADQPVDTLRANHREQLQAARRNELGLDQKDALSEQEKRAIQSKVNRKFPKTDPEKERDQEIRARVQNAEKLWATVAKQINNQNASAAASEGQSS